jgi:NAD(P)-dependent dehydrogenase (short-subunit alcohol dehydrogenase family)
MSQWSAFPRHYGLNFTKTYRTKAEGLTDPLNIKLPKPFVVLITGAGKGLGFNITLAYAQAGASGIIICSRTESDLESLTNQVKSLNPDCSVLSRVCDTTSNEQLATLAADVKEEFGRLDVAIANAGIISKYIYDEDGSNRRLPQGILHDSDFERVVDINLIGSYRVAKYFIPLLIATKDGPQSYIVITSLASHNTSSEITPIAYNVTKNALNRLVESIHGDHHDVDGINAFSLHPGAVLTPQTEYHTGDIWEHSKCSATLGFFCK